MSRGSYKWASVRPHADAVALIYGEPKSAYVLDTREIDAGQTFDVLCNDGLHYRGQVKEVWGRSTKRMIRLHFLYWNEKYDYVGPLKDLYIAPDGIYSEQDGISTRNTYPSSEALNPMPPGSSNITSIDGGKQVITPPSINKWSVSEGGDGITTSTKRARPQSVVWPELGTGKVAKHPNGSSSSSSSSSSGGGCKSVDPLDEIMELEASEAREHMTGKGAVSLHRLFSMDDIATDWHESDHVVVDDETDIDIEEEVIVGCGGAEQKGFAAAHTLLLERLQDLRGQRKTLDTKICLLEEMLMERIVASTTSANA